MQTTESAEGQPYTLTSVAPRGDHHGFVCFVCSRCEYPICTAEDVLRSVVTDGTTASAFCYQLDDLLDLNCAVPCYSAEERANTAVTVSGRLLEVPLLPTARLLALTSIVESHAYARTLAEELLSRHPAPSATNPGSERLIDQSADSDAAHAELAPIRHYGASTSCRIDLICARMEVLQHGLATSRLDRRTGDGDETWTRGGYDRDDAVHRDDEAASQTTNHDVTSHCPRAQTTSAASIPYDVLAAAHRAPPATQWRSPGNFAVEEAYMVVTRTTDSARHRWFNGFDCVRRVECPDCHLALGFVFARAGASIEADGDGGGNVVRYAGVRHVASESAFAPAESRESERPAEPNSDAAFPNIFVGLELKRIRQRQWGLHEFQVRYSKAQHLSTFRTLFPEAEELQSLYHRLTALRTQAELYKNLLHKHKEQYDVQNALLQTHKERIVAYEKQSQMMQQVINKLRINLDMQTTQIRTYSELLQGHRLEIRTQQQQILAQQQLLTRQSQTIDLQQAEIRQLKGQLPSSNAVLAAPGAANMQSPVHRVIPSSDKDDGAGSVKERATMGMTHEPLEENKDIVRHSCQHESTCNVSLSAGLAADLCLKRCDDQVQPSNTAHLLSSASFAPNSPDKASSSTVRGATAVLPPRHLLAIRPRGTFDHAVDPSPTHNCTKEESDGV